MHVCRPNIGPLERRRRLRLGIMSTAAGIASAYILAAAAAPAMLRALVFIPIAAAAYGFLQYREKT